MTYSGTSDFLYDNINAAAADIARAIVGQLQNTEGLHAPTALAFSGFMVGEILLRASGLINEASTPGQPIDHSWLTNNGLRLVQMLQEWFQRQNIVIADLPETFGHFGTALKPKAEPALLAITIRPVLEELFLHHQIGAEERVLAMALAATRLVLSAQAVINPAIGAAVIVDALVMGARTIPLQNPEDGLAPDLRFDTNRYLPLTAAS